jgi:peptide/nickel transport system permease protein
MIRPGLLRGLRRTELFALLSLATMAIASIVVPLFAAEDPLAIGDVLATRLAPPFSVDATGTFHLLGTDRFGRDLFVRVMLAGRISLAVGVVGSLVAALLGTVAGAIAGWHGGWIDRGILALTNVLLAVPRLVLLLVCASLWRPGLTTVVVVLVATGWMGVARMVRAEVIGVMAQPYVESATALGLHGARVLWRHVLPNALGAAGGETTPEVGNAILL